MKIALFIIGVLLLISSGTLFYLYSEEEKPAFYFLGHWFDVIYEVSIPMSILGIIVILSGFVLKKKKAEGS